MFSQASVSHSVHRGRGEVSISGPMSFPGVGVSVPGPFRGLGMLSRGRVCLRVGTQPPIPGTSGRGRYPAPCRHGT